MFLLKKIANEQQPFHTSRMFSYAKHLKYAPQVFLI